MSDGRSQLIGALGAWLEASPEDASSADRTRATQLILDTSLLGVRTADLDACKAVNLDASDTALLARVRAWAYPDDFAGISPSDDDDDDHEGVDPEDVAGSDSEAGTGDDPNAVALVDAVDVVDLRETGDVAKNAPHRQYVGAGVSEGPIDTAAAAEASEAAKVAASDHGTVANSSFGIAAPAAVPERSSFQASDLSPAPPEWLHDKRRPGRQLLNEETILVTLCLIAVVVLIVRQLVG